MHGSTSTWVLLVNVIVARRSSLDPGFVNKRMVCETFHELAEEVTQSHRVRVASAVSSNILTSTFSTSYPALVVTVMAYINPSVCLVRRRLTLPLSCNALYTNKYLTLCNVASTLDEGFQCHQSCQLFPCSISLRGSTQASIVALLLHQDVAAVVSFRKNRGLEQSILQSQGRGPSSGQVRRPN